MPKSNREGKGSSNWSVQDFHKSGTHQLDCLNACTDADEMNRLRGGRTSVYVSRFVGGWRFGKNWGGKLGYRKKLP